MKKRFTAFSGSLLLSSLLWSQANFLDLTSQAGVGQVGFNQGVTTVDFNNDGFDDIFATSGMANGMLYQNMGNGTFTNVTSQSGIVTSPTAQFPVWGDVNNDGWLDLFIGAWDGPNKLYLNNHDGTFTDIAVVAGVATGTKVKSALFADVDRDGFLDIYLARLGLQNILYRNTGNGTFTDITLLAGATDPSISMGAVFFDYDNDGDPDLYLTHDANVPNILYRNNGNPFGFGVTFTDVSPFSGANIAAMGMGVDVGDVNNDGWLDLYITNLGPNTLLINNGNGIFSNIAPVAGVDDTGMGWGCSFLDYDNDGWQDIYMANDSYFSPKPNLLYRNNGWPAATNSSFNIVSQNTILHSMEAGYGFGCFDYNNDGKLDIYLANYSGSEGNRLFKNNEQNNNNWLKIKLFGIESNACAIGARVQVQFNGMLLTDEVSGGSGWASQNSLVQHVGLGNATMVDLLTVRWPSGIIDSFAKVEANQTIEITEGESDIIVEEPVNPTPYPDTLAWIKPGLVHKQMIQPVLNSQSEIWHQDLEIQIAPNPFSNELLVTILNSGIIAEPMHIALMDITGKTVWTSILNLISSSRRNTLKLEPPGLSTGLYYLKATIGEDVFLRKIVKL